MKIYSEITKKFYETADECLKAEEELANAQKKEEEEKERLLAERKARADEVSEARRVMIEAQDNYQKVLSDFLDDYGSYHYSTKNIDDIPKLLSPLNDWFWKF